MAPRAKPRGASRDNRVLARVRAREFLRDAASLLRLSGIKLFAMALPFGMASIWFEQTMLGLSPRFIKDQRGAAMLAFYGSMAIAYMAYAAIAAVALPQWSRATESQVRIQPFNGRRLAAVLIIAVVAPLGTVAGLVAAVIPGIVVWLSWVVATPMAATSKKSPWQAMSCSSRVTWGSRRSLFYVFAAVQFSVFVLSALTAALMGQPVSALLDDPKPVTALEGLIGGLVETLQLVASGAVCCVAYARLQAAEAQAITDAQGRTQ